MKKSYLLTCLATAAATAGTADAALMALDGADMSG